MHVVVHLTAGPRWLAGKPVHEQGPPVLGHMAAMRRHHEAGRLLLGGPFRRAAGIAVLRVGELDRPARSWTPTPRSWPAS